MNADVLTYLDDAIDARLGYYDFWHFCLWMDKEFFESRQFTKEIADAFNDLSNKYSNGITTKVSVSMPPRAGKSYVTSLFCAWFLGKNPDKSVMRNTVTQRLYEKFSYDVRNIIKSERYRKVFPKIELSADKQNLQGWNLTTAKQVSYFGAGVGGTIIGFGCNLAVTDDLYSGFEQAVSETYNESVFRWKQGSHDSRKERASSEIYIGTRWSKNDVIGKALSDGQVDVEITIPALNENNETFCDAVKSTAEYLKIKDETDEEIWSAEYQQEPIEIKGLLFPASELKYFSPMEQISDYSFCAVDPADAGGDDMAAPFCSLIGNGIFISDVIYNNSGTDSNIPALVEKIITGKLNACEIEGNSAWVLFAKDVRNKVQERYEDCDIRIIKNTANKQTRILAQSAFIKNHFYFLKEEYRNSDYKKFMKVLTS